MARSVARTALLVVGSMLMMLALAVLGRAYLGQWMHDLQRPAVAQADSNPLPSAAEVAPAAPAPLGAPPTSAATGPPKASPTPLPDFGHPVRIVIPSIDVNAPVEEVGIKDGVYEVPWWDVGWHRDSASLGRPGNTIFDGHLTTIDAGKVFSRLHELRPGDVIYLFSPGYRTAWVVASSERVPNTENGFVAPSEDVRVTLYTCEGTFDWKTRTYSHYRVVVARFVEATAG